MAATPIYQAASPGPRQAEELAERLGEDGVAADTVGLRWGSATLTRLRNGDSSWLRAGTALWAQTVERCAERRTLCSPRRPSTADR